LVIGSFPKIFGLIIRVSEVPSWFLKTSMFLPVAVSFVPLSEVKVSEKSMKGTPRAKAIIPFVTVFFLANFFVAEEIEKLKAGVVRVTVTTREGKQKVGGGFIARLEADAVHIVTASHVVEGTRDIEVEFFTMRNQPVPAKVIRMEGGDPKGIAVLFVKGRIPPGTVVHALASSVSARDGEAVSAIGFPGITNMPWAVITGNKVGQDGRTIVFSGPVDEGNSGGPLIKDGKVIGVVTEVGERLAYAVPTEIVTYILKGWGVDGAAQSGCATNLWVG